MMELRAKGGYLLSELDLRHSRDGACWQDCIDINRVSGYEALFLQSADTGRPWLDANHITCRSEVPEVPVRVTQLHTNLFPLQH